MKKTVLFLLTALLFAFPTLTSRVVDEAQILSPHTKRLLEKKLKNLEENTSVQLVVASVKSLEGMSIEEYGYKLGRHWGIGQKKKNNGVILLIAPNEKKVRIEVGYGLEGDITDAKAFLIINDIIPYFKKGNYDAGVVKGVEEITALIRPTKNEKKSNGNIYIIFYFLAIFMIIIIGKKIKFLKNRINSVVVFLFLSFFVYIITKCVIASLAAASIGAWFVRKRPGKKNSTRKENVFIGDNTSDSKSGFRGGGGDFGGGGASGSW